MVLKKDRKLMRSLPAINFNVQDVLPTRDDVLEWIANSVARRYHNYGQKGLIEAMQGWKFLPEKLENSEFNERPYAIGLDAMIVQRATERYKAAIVEDLDGETVGELYEPYMIKKKVELLMKQSLKALRAADDNCVDLGQKKASPIAELERGMTDAENKKVMDLVKAKVEALYKESKEKATFADKFKVALGFSKQKPLKRDVNRLEKALKKPFQGGLLKNQILSREQRLEASISCPENSEKGFEQARQIQEQELAQLKENACKLVEALKKVSFDTEEVNELQDDLEILKSEISRFKERQENGRLFSIKMKRYRDELSALKSDDKKVDESSLIADNEQQVNIIVKKDDIKAFKSAFKSSKPNNDKKKKKDIKFSFFDQRIEFDKRENAVTAEITNTEALKNDMQAELNRLIVELDDLDVSSKRFENKLQIDQGT